MQKTFFSSVLCLFVLSACSQSPEIPAIQPEMENTQADQATQCSYLCGRKIPEICENEIETAKTEGTFSEESVFEEISCQLMCEAEWTEKTIGCVSNADDCAQIMDSSPYCLENAEDDSEKELPPVEAGCPSACEKYKKCASYGDDVTQTDLEDAYISCMEVCATWNKSVSDCINQCPINTPADCGPMTACALKGF